jgi:hypothetical protein
MRPKQSKRAQPTTEFRATQREVFEIFLLAAHVKSDGDDENEIAQQNRAIDRQWAVHVGGYLATDEQR